MTEESSHQNATVIDLGPHITLASHRCERPDCKPAFNDPFEYCPKDRQLDADTKAGKVSPRCTVCVCMYCKTCGKEIQVG